MEIPLPQGKIALIDDEDWPIVAGSKWSCYQHRNTFYAHAKREGRVISMHRLILRVPLGFQIDHINGNGLDNRRANLRVATHAENQRNSGIRRNNTSGYKGVVRQGTYRWRAQIRCDGLLYLLGSFDTKVEAACAYDHAARRLHGEFARLNFP